MIKLQVGKFYKTRDGHKVGPLGCEGPRKVGGRVYPWDDTSNGNAHFWSDTGKCDDGFEYDLIAEWTDTPTIWADNEGWGDWTSAGDWDITNNDVQFECVDGIHKVRTRPRIKPEPKRETVTLTGLDRGYWCFGSDRVKVRDTHRITFDTIDGEPDCSTIRMERLT